MKPISLKLEDHQLKLLEAVSKQTHIPKSSLIRQGIDLILKQFKEDSISSELHSEIDSLIQDDKELLKRLAK